MQFTNHKVGDYYVVEVGGRLDTVTSRQFDEQCENWLSQGRVQVVVDMSGVEYISSAGLRSVLSAAKKLRGRGGDLFFCGLQGMVADVFTMSGFTTMFKIFTTREQALSD